MRRLCKSAFPLPIPRHGCEQSLRKEMYWWENSLSLSLFAFCSKHAFTDVRESRKEGKRDSNKFKRRATAVHSDDKITTPGDESFPTGFERAKEPPCSNPIKSSLRMVGMREISPPHPSTWKSNEPGSFNHISLMYRPDPLLVHPRPHSSLSEIPYQG